MGVARIAVGADLRTIKQTIDHAEAAAGLLHGVVDGQGDVYGRGVGEGEDGLTKTYVGRIVGPDVHKGVQDDVLVVGRGPQPHGAAPVHPHMKPQHALLARPQRDAAVGHAHALFERCGVGRRVREKSKRGGQRAGRRVAQIKTQRRIGAGGGRQFEAHGVDHHLGSRARERIGQMEVHHVGVKQQGLLVAEEARLPPRGRAVVGGLGKVEHVEQEIAVVVPPVSPVHVEKALRVYAVDHKGMAAARHDVSRVEHGAASLHLAIHQRKPVVGLIQVAVAVSSRAKAEGTLQGVDEMADVGAARREAPVHLRGHPAIVRQAGHGVQLFGRVGLAVVIVQNEARVHLRAGQHVGNVVVGRRPAVQRVAQHNGAAIVGDDFL